MLKAHSNVSNSTEDQWTELLSSSVYIVDQLIYFATREHAGESYLQLACLFFEWASLLLLSNWRPRRIFARNFVGKRPAEYAERMVGWIHHLKLLICAIGTSTKAFFELFPRPKRVDRRTPAFASKSDPGELRRARIIKSSIFDALKIDLNNNISKNIYLSCLRHRGIVIVSTVIGSKHKTPCSILKPHRWKISRDTLPSLKMHSRLFLLQ